MSEGLFVMLTAIDAQWLNSLEVANSNILNLAFLFHVLLEYLLKEKQSLIYYLITQ